MTWDNLPVALTPEPLEVDIWGDDPRCLINLLPETVRQVLRKTREMDPELFELDEHDLAMKIRASNRPPRASDNRLRISFWQEYANALRTNRNMAISRVTTGCYPRSHFHTHVLTKPERAAWLLCPPVEYLMKTTEMLDLGLDRLREILELSPVDPVTKRLNPQVASAQLRIVVMLDQRLKGAAIQRIESKNLSVKVDASAANEMSMEELNQKIAELERANLVAQNIPMAAPGPSKDKDENVIDVTPG